MARPVIGVLILLLVPAAMAASVSDDAGDVSRRLGDPPIDKPAVDIIDVEGVLDGDRLSLALDVAGDLPIGGQANSSEPDRRYSYLFIIGPGVPQGETLYGQDSTTVICLFHHGQADLACEITQGEGVLRGSGASGARVSARIDVPWNDTFSVGAIAHESVPNATSDTGRDILAQDFTDNALPYNQAPEDDAFAPSAPGTSAPEPWWRTPWILVVVAVVAIVALFVPWGSLRKKD